MIRQLISIIVALAAVAGAGYWYLMQDPADDGKHANDGMHGHGTHDMTEEPTGPHGGRLLEQDNFAIELTIFESGIDPEFRLYAYDGGKPVDPSKVDATIALERIDGQVDRFTFNANQDYLRGEGIVTEPHSFTVRVNVQYDGQSYNWQYDSIEGRTQIPPGIAAEAGIQTEPAGPGAIMETLPVTGRLVQVPDQQSQVRAPYPGIVKVVRKRVGEQVRKGEHLLTVENSASLQDYVIRAPINGVIVERHIQQSESTDGEILFVIANLDRLWIELDIFSKDINKVETGMRIEAETFSGKPISATLERIWPVVRSDSQSFRAIATIDNTEGLFYPGLRVTGMIHIATHDVAIAISHKAIQSFRDFKVVYARYDDTYEVRMLELGRSDRKLVEVLSGIKPGTEYVVENSYLIKADIEKSGASHAH